MLDCRIQQMGLIRLFWIRSLTS